VSNRPLRSLITAAVAVAVVVVVGLLVASESESAPPLISPPPANAQFDYQIGGDYKPPSGTRVVSRDWFSGTAAPSPIYSICYVNAFQTQANEPGTKRPDELGAWPRNLVLRRLGDDPNWAGEHLIDISTARKRARAARWIQPMLESCAAKGFRAVEFDNLDSWTRFRGTAKAAQVPFGRSAAVAYAELLTDQAAELGLAAAQKNTVQLTAAERERIGFSFAIAEECARWSECDRYRRAYGGHLIDIEYRPGDFAKACRAIGAEISVVYRDLNVSTPAGPRYRYDAC